MIFTYGLFIQPLAELLEDMFFRPKIEQEAHGGTPEMGLIESRQAVQDPVSETTSKLVRIGIILFTFLLGLCIPDFGLVCNLVGSIANTLIGLILPTLFYLKLKSERTNESLYLSEVLLNGLILVFAVVLMLTSGTVTAISIVCCHTKGLHICTIAPFDRVTT